jgi:hypothetical protein
MAAELVARGGQQLFGKHGLARRRLIALYVRHRERKILLLKEKQNLARAAALEQRSAQDRCTLSSGHSTAERRLAPP